MLGLPAKFDQWRENQSEAVESIVDTPERFLVQVCPTGFGKSLTYMTAAMLSPGRAVLLTSTKGLQTQLMNDFGHMPEVEDMRGRGNYPCRLNTHVNCDLGACVFGVKCSMKEEGGCFYFDQLRRAKSAKIIITNYAYWMSQNGFSDGIGKFELMVLDEAHSAPDHVISFIAVDFSKKNRIESKILDLNDSLPNTSHGWYIWACDKLDDVNNQIQSAKERRKEKLYLQLKRTKEKLDRLTSIDATWVWEEDDYHVGLSPIWPAPFTEEVLFMGIDKVVLTSATVVAKTANLMGVDDAKVEEWPHTFPLANRPLIHVPTVRMNYRNGAAEERQWLSRLDQIIRDRVGTKGVIHTVSYKRRDLVLSSSKYADYMITHSNKDTEMVVHQFKASQDPLILVSPSMATGWDFPDDECRWQVIIKLPYPDSRGNILKARSKADKDYTSYITMQQLIQACGRGVRTKDDWCETFIIDDNIQWFIDHYSHLSVAWFKGAYQKKITIPKPERRV